MEPQMNADEHGPTTPEKPPAQGEIRDLVTRLKKVIQEHWGEHQAELDAIVLCNEILAVESDFSTRAQTLAGKCYAQGAEIIRLRKLLRTISEGVAALARKADSEEATANHANVTADQRG